MVRDQRGSALAMVLIILAVGVTLGVAVLIFGAGERTQVSMHENEIQAYLSARSGAELTAGMIADKVLNPTADDVDDLDFGQAGTVHIVLDFDGNSGSTSGDDVIWIEAQSAVPVSGAQVSKTLAIRMAKREIPWFNYAIDSLSALDLDKMGTIIGDLNSENGLDETGGYDPTDPNKDSLPGTFTGNLETQPFSGQPVILPLEANEVDTDGSPFSVAGNTISHSGYYEPINENSSLIFDTNGKDIFIKCREFNVNQGINVLGNGAVFIYTEELLMQQAQSAQDDMIIINVCDIDGDSKDNNGDFDYVDFGETLGSPLSGSITAQADFYALINAPYVKNFDFGGNGTLHGGVICYSFSDAGAGAQTRLEFISADTSGFTDRMGFSISEYREHKD